MLSFHHSLMASMLLCGAFLFSNCLGTADFYANGYGCNPPKVGEMYMGQAAVAGSELTMTVDGAKKTPAGVYEVVPGQQYNIQLFAPKWNEWVINISGGKFAEDEDYKLGCEGSQALARSADTVVLPWTAPSKFGTRVTLTIGHAPRYTTVNVQTFQFNAVAVTDDVKEL